MYIGVDPAIKKCPQITAKLSVNSWNKRRFESFQMRHLWPFLSVAQQESSTRIAIFWSVNVYKKNVIQTMQFACSYRTSADKITLRSHNIWQILLRSRLEFTSIQWKRRWLNLNRAFLAFILIHRKRKTLWLNDFFDLICIYICTKVHLDMTPTCNLVLSYAKGRGVL